MALLQPILIQMRAINVWRPFRFLLVVTASLVLAMFVGRGDAWAGGLSGNLSGNLSGLGQPELVAIAGNSLFHVGGDRPQTLGLQDGHLAACPSTPNCVSSQATDPDQAIAALTYSVSPRQAMQALKQVIDDSERAEVMKADDGYLYAEFTSRWMGFVDDVEFALEPERSQIQVRSASRLGESDLGVNRKRIETIRAQFEALVGTTAAEGSPPTRESL